MIKRTLHGIINILAIATIISICVLPRSSYANTYGSGTYGSCQYSSCSITLTDSGTITDNITPTPTGTTCSVTSDAVSVTTNSSSGYIVNFSDGDTNNSLSDGAGHSIAASTGTAAAPVMLAANTWGYRVDSYSGFGAGPTSAVASGSTPSLAFAGVPLSTGTPDTIISSSIAASTAATTKVWYGTCVNMTTPANSYTDGVIYTALTQS